MHTGFADECVFLDMESAWGRVLSHAPSLIAADMEIDVQEANKRQVSLRPNPVAVIEADNLGVSHPNNDAEPPQITYSLSQTLELGGKRMARRALASSAKVAAYWDATIERLNRRCAFTRAFIEASVAQERLVLAEERTELAKKILETVCVQVSCGKVSPLEEKRARIAINSAQMGEREALSQLLQAKKRLSGMWGDPCPDFDGVLFDLYAYEAPPCQSTLLDGLYEMPDFMRAKQQIFASSRNLKLQKANAIPDVTVMVGYRTFLDSSQHGWVVGAEMPLPFSNFNQGNIRRARVEMGQAEYMLEACVQDLKEKISVVYERVVAAYEESEIIKMGIWAETAEVCDLTQTGYQQGKLDYLTLLDSQNMLVEIEEKYIEVLSEYHINRAELNRLTGF